VLGFAKIGEVGVVSFDECDAFIIWVQGRVLMLLTSRAIVVVDDVAAELVVGTSASACSTAATSCLCILKRKCRRRGCLHRYLPCRRLCMLRRACEVICPRDQTRYPQRSCPSIMCAERTYLDSCLNWLVLLLPSHCTSPSHSRSFIQETVADVVPTSIACAHLRSTRIV